MLRHVENLLHTSDAVLKSYLEAVDVRWQFAMLYLYCSIQF